MPTANDPEANTPYPERDAAPETGQPAPPPTGEGGTPPRPAPTFDARPAAAAPKIRIQRGATVYAPWRRGGAPPQTPQQPSMDAPAAPQTPVNYATPAVAPTVIIRHAPGSQNWTATEAGSEPTIEMTIEFAAVAEEELAQTVAAEAPSVLMAATPAPIAAETVPLEARTTPPVSEEWEAEATAFIAPQPAAPVVIAPIKAETRIAPPAQLATDKTPAPAQEEVETTAFVPAETTLPSETPETALTESAAPLTPTVLAEAIMPPFLTEPELEPELSAPLVAERPVAAETSDVGTAIAATPPPAELFTAETPPEPIAAEPVVAPEPIVEIPPFPELDPIPLVPEITLLIETLPLIVALRQPIRLLEPLSLPEPPVFVPETAEELQEAEAVSQPLDAAVEAAPLIVAPALDNAEAHIVLVERLKVEQEADSVNAVPLLSPGIEAVPQSFAPLVAETVAEAVSEPPQEAPAEETFAPKFAPVAEATNAPAPVIEEKIAPVAQEAEPIVAVEERQSGESVLPLEAVTATSEFTLPIGTKTEADAPPTVATDAPELSLSPESADAETIVSPAAPAEAEPLSLPEYATSQAIVEAESPPIVLAPVEIEPIAVGIEAATEFVPQTLEPPVAETIPSPISTLASETMPDEQTRSEQSAEQSPLAEPITAQVKETAQHPAPNTQRPASSLTPAPFDAHLDVAPVLPTTRRTPGTPAPPVAQASPETPVKPRGLLLPNRAARPAATGPSAGPSIEKMNRAAAQTPAAPLRLPPPIVPGYRPTRQEIADAERRARENEERQEAAEWERFRRTPPPLSPALPGAARFFAVIGLICATLGLLVRPLADAAKGTAPLAAVAGFANALEGDSRMQWRNLQRRPEGGAVSASRRTEARVVVILAEQRRGASRDEYPIGRVELARLMRLCHDAGVPVIGIAADTAALPRTTAIAVGGPQPVVKKVPDPLALAIRDIRRAGTDAPRPTFTILPAFFPAKSVAGAATLRANTDPLLPKQGVITGFVGPSPVAPDAALGGENGTPLRRSLTLSARVAPPKGGTAAALSLPAALAFLTLPNAALWPQVGGTETKDSDISRGLAAIFAYPKTLTSNGKPGEKPVAIDFGLLQSDPEGVQVVSADYVRSLTADERRTLLESRPVVIGLDRPADRIQTPLSSQRFVILPPVKPTMARAEAEGRAAAMLLARAERNSQPENLAALAASAAVGNDAALPERPGRIFSAATLPPPAPYMEPVPTDYRGWIAFLPAALLGFLLSLAGRRLAAPAVKAPNTPKPESKLKRSSTRFWGDFERSVWRIVPAVLGLALAGVVGWVWRVYGTPGFASYIEFPGFAPWAAPWASSLFTAVIFFLALIGMWMAGPAWRGKGVALIVAFSALAFCVLAVQDFVLFPAWTPLLAPLGGFLLGSAARLGRRQ